MTEMTEMAEMTEMTEKFLSANNLSTSRTAERHARGQKVGRTVELLFFVQVNLFRISCPCPIRVSFQVPILSRSPKEQLGFLVVTDFFSRFLFCDNREGRKLLRLLCRKEKLVHRVVMNDWQTGSSSLLVQLSS